ncbi:MAG TPA: hypothetical protein PKX55_04270 [Leptospiraceae bacterium]|nr:hypothetical protein [Leptospiraceae bacterium]HNK58849.1 hypothetical protein [Leptospiraceae bacterium]
MFASDLTIFEISFGVYYGFRLGINFDELLDFLFGIFGFDFKGDYGAKYFTFCIDYSKSTEKELETRTKILDRIRTNTTSENTK